MLPANADSVLNSGSSWKTATVAALPFGTGVIGRRQTSGSTTSGNRSAAAVMPLLPSVVKHYAESAHSTIGLAQSFSERLNLPDEIEEKVISLFEKTALQIAHILTRTKMSD